MHELSVCQALMAQVAEVATQHEASAVSTVVLHIGPLAGVEPQLLRDAFPIASADTVADGAELQIETLPLRVRCDSCGAETTAQPNRLLCGACGDWHTQLISGDELLLARVELITEAPET